MALPEAAAWQVVVQGHCAGAQEWNNVMHLVPSGTLDQSIANTQGAAIRAAYLDNLSADVAGDCTLERITFRDLSVTPNTEFVYYPSDVTYGEAVSDSMPPQIAGLVSWRTAHAGRAYRGRTFLAGVAEASNTSGGGPSSGFLTSVAGFVADMLALTVDLAIVSYYSGHTWTGSAPYKKIPTPRVTPLVNAVVAGSPGVSWATMRSRSSFSG